MFFFSGFSKLNEAVWDWGIAMSWPRWPGCDLLGASDLGQLRWQSSMIFDPWKRWNMFELSIHVTDDNLNILYWAEFFVGLECVETRKRKTNCQVHKGFCLLSNQMNSWGLVGSLSQPSRFFEVPCFFLGVDTAQWNYEVMSNQVKNRMPCRACYSTFFKLSSFLVDMICISEAYLKLFLCPFAAWEKQSWTVCWSHLGSFKNTNWLMIVGGLERLDCPIYWRSSCSLHGLPINNSWFWHVLTLLKS